jgi:cytochrome c peroxidase
MHTTSTLRTLCALTIGACLAACGGSNDNTDASSGPTGQPPLTAVAALGKKMFADVSLSASGRQSCASCHSDDNAHGAPDALAVQLGGVLLDLQGKRSSGSINYLSTDTAFHFDDDGAPEGGFFWDGRASSLSEQAGQPFLGAVEMANGSKADVIAKVARAAYAEEFKSLFGAYIFGRTDDAFDRLTLALEQFQREDVSFHSFSSKYDEFLRGKVDLSAQESRGLALFNSEQKGNCAACHTSAKGDDGSFPLFTDFSYDNLGVPRNPAIARNADAGFFDLGLCDRPELAARADLCGAFKVPTLRNVAQRQVFFHNGRFASLKEAITFYVQRDTNPERWYSKNTDGTVKKFDDLPEKYRDNVNVTEAPYNRKPGDAPALSDAEVDDVIAFLNTLSDGYKP